MVTATHARGIAVDCAVEDVPSMGGAFEMRKAYSLAALAALALIRCGTAYAQNEPESPSDAFAAGTAAFAAEDYSRALEHFEAALAAGLDTPAVHYNIGVCRYKLGLYPAARKAFAVIAERYPAMRGLAEYNLGLVALQMDDRARAERHFQAALDSTSDETIRHLASRQLGLDAEAEIEQATKDEWLAIVDGRLGYDDNVLLLADEISLPDGQSTESRFVELWGFFSRPVAASAFRFDANVYSIQYPEASIFDQSVLHISTPYEWTLGSWRGEAGPQLGWTTIDGDVLDRRVGLGVRASRAIAPGMRVEFRYIHDDVDEGDPEYAFFAGERALLEVRLDRHGERGRLTLGRGIERNDREAAAVSPRRSRWTVRYRRDLGPSWLIDVEAVWRDSRYTRLAEPRDEELAELALEVTRILPGGWLANASVSSADNDSDVSIATYRRRRAAVGITKQF
jgi:tetratricopeptide (TPR) repeat protein